MSFYKIKLYKGIGKQNCVTNNPVDLSKDLSKIWKNCAMNYNKFQRKSNKSKNRKNNVRKIPPQYIAIEEITSI